MHLILQIRGRREDNQKLLKDLIGELQSVCPYLHTFPLFKHGFKTQLGTDTLAKPTLKLR